MTNPELDSILNEQIEDQLRKMGVDPSRATNEEKIRAVSVLKEEYEKGFTTTPDGQRFSGYTSAGYEEDGRTSIRDVADDVNQKVSGLDPEKKNQLFVVGGVFALALLLLVFRLLSGFNMNIGSWFAAKPTEVPEIPVNYSVLIENLGDQLSSDFDEPQSFSFRTNTFAVYPSKAKLVASTSVWCDQFSDETYNDACWLQGSIVNMVFGIRYKTYIGLFNDVSPGEVVNVKFGTREINYTITEVKQVKINDVKDVFGQHSPKLTFVVFGERDKKDNLVDPNNQYRTIILATPNQEDLAGINTNIENTTQVIDYVGESTNGKIFDLDTNIKIRVYSAGDSGGVPYYKVVATLKPTRPSVSVSQYAQFIYTLETGLTYSPMQQTEDKTNGEYKLVFAVQSNNTEQQPFSLKVNIPGQEKVTIIVGNIYSPLPLEYVSIDENEITTEYNADAKQLTVKVPYVMDKESPPEICQQCMLIVNGEPVYPNGQVYFNPAKAGTDSQSIVVMNFSITINISNINNMQLLVGKYLFALVPEQQSTPTPNP